MNKVLLGILLLGATQSFAQEPAQAAVEQQPVPSRWDGVKTWFQHFKEGLESTGAERNYQRRNVRVTAVAAVRGGKQRLDNPNKPYVKGKLDAKLEASLKKERAELESAVQLVLAGKPEDGLTQLNAFEKAHPSSIYLEDVRAAREKIKEIKALPEAQTPPATATP